MVAAPLLYLVPNLDYVQEKFGLTTGFDPVSNVTAASTSIAIPSLPQSLSDRLRHTMDERRRTDAELKQLGRLRVPYEVKGGVGLSGVDFYPRLLPIEPTQAQMRLFTDQ